MKKLDTVRIISLAGLVLGGLASLIANYASEKMMEQTIDEKVKEALANRENEEEES